MIANKAIAWKGRGLPAAGKSGTRRGMEILFDIVTPVFGLMAVGYVAAVSGLFPKAARAVAFV